MLIRELREKLLQDGDCFQDIIGQDSTKYQLKSALLMGRHTIIAGPPGIGKTTLAKNVAKLLPRATVNDCQYNCMPEKPLCPECKSSMNRKTKTITGQERFVRIQGSPDLTSEDLLGDIEPANAIKYGPTAPESFRPGKIFRANNGVLFFDELNRCPEKVQNSLLQALEEGKATIGSHTIDLEADFIFIGTMNPQDTSTEKLSDVLIDRFDIIYMGYPETSQAEEEIVTTKGQKTAEYPEHILKRTIAFIRSLRSNSRLEKLPSVRASIGLYERAQANAQLRGAGTVSIEDVRNAVISVLAHRIELKPSSKYLMSSEQLLKEELDDFIEKGDYR
ncbi:ATP-binding protein [Candidatus Woesearchaeota archaeon]|nr:ATP-binding protein [Candidatus Woesearchaeota archaeon]